MVKLLLSRGADVNAEAASYWIIENSSGVSPTALFVAEQGAHTEIVQLLKHAAVFRDVVDAGHVEKVRWYLRQGAEQDGYSIYSPKIAFFQAVQNSDLDMARMLLEEGADVNDRGDYGETPLIRASTVGCVEMVELLLSKGAEVNAKSTYLSAIGDVSDIEHTALRSAELRGHTEVADILRAAGAK